MSFQRNEEASECNKIDTASIAEVALVRTFRSAARHTTTSADARALLGKVRQAEERARYPFVTVKIIAKLLELFITDRPSVAKGSSSDDVYTWVYLSEGVALWLWWRRRWEQHSAFAKEWIIRLTNAVLEEARRDTQTQKGGYWRCSTVDLFVKFAAWNEDPAEFLIAPEHTFQPSSLNGHSQMERERLERRFESEQEFLWWKLGWIDRLRCFETDEAQINLKIKEMIASRTSRRECW